MGPFKVGFARVNINPDLGTPIAGYYVPREAKGFLDDLQGAAMALELGKTRVLLISIDACKLRKELSDEFRQHVETVTGIPYSCVVICATHTHTGPINNLEQLKRNPNGADGPLETLPGYEAVAKYVDFLKRRIGDAAVMALADLKEGKMGFIQGWAPERIAYIRRYRMKDGTTMTCPPINDPNIDHPLGELDQRVHVLRFDREGGDTVVLVNYGLHADTVNGELISSDFPGWMRRTVEAAIPGTKCIFFNGAEGDVGSTHVFPSGGDMNDTEISFDNEMKSPGMARFIGRALAGTVLQVYDKVEYVPVDSMKILHKTLEIPANVPTAQELPQAKLYKQLHDEGRDDEIPYTAMELTTVVAEACRMCALEHGPESFAIDLTGLQIGPVALIGIPGEPFTDIGVRIKDTEGWAAIMPCCLVNGSDCCYFPTEAAFSEGGYEARSSKYKSSVARILVDGSKELLNELK